MAVKKKIQEAFGFGNRQSQKNKGKAKNGNVYQNAGDVIHGNIYNKPVIICNLDSIDKNKQSEDLQRENKEIYPTCQNYNSLQKIHTKRKHFENFVFIFRKIGIYTALTMPIWLSISVLVLNYLFPLTISFPNYIGWLFPLILSLDCLSFFVLFLLWVISFINKLFSICDSADGAAFDFPAGALCVLGGIVLAVGLYEGSPVHNVWWIYFIAAFLTTVGLSIEIVRLIKVKKSKYMQNPRALFIVLSLFFFGLALCRGAWDLSYCAKLYEKNLDGTYTYVLKYYSDYGKRTENLEIPSKYKGKPVTSVRWGFTDDLESERLINSLYWSYYENEKFMRNLYLKSVIIPEGIDYIAQGAFHYYSSIVSVVFENTEGWTISRYNGRYSVSSADLSNPVTAAIYLLKYSDYAWERS